MRHLISGILLLGALDVLAAIEVARQLGPEANVVTLMVDSGLKYLSTEVYRGQDAPAPRGGVEPDSGAD